MIVVTVTMKVVGKILVVTVLLLEVITDANSPRKPEIYRPVNVVVRLTGSAVIPIPVNRTLITPERVPDRTNAKQLPYVSIRLTNVKNRKKFGKRPRLSATRETIYA